MRDVEQERDRQRVAEIRRKISNAKTTYRGIIDAARERGSITAEQRFNAELLQSELSSLRSEWITLEPDSSEAQNEAYYDRCSPPSEVFLPEASKGESHRSGQPGGDPGSPAADRGTPNASQATSVRQWLKQVARQSG